MGAGLVVLAQNKGNYDPQKTKSLCTIQHTSEYYSISLSLQFPYANEHRIYDLLVLLKVAWKESLLQN